MCTNEYTNVCRHVYRQLCTDIGTDMCVDELSMCVDVRCRHVYRHAVSMCHVPFGSLVDAVLVSAWHICIHELNMPSACPDGCL